MKKYLDPNSMLIWYPKTKNLDIPQPRTEIVEVPFRVLVDMMDSLKLPKKYKLDITMKANDIGFPLFVRTDLSSGKHQWKDTCYVATEKDLMQHIYNVVEFNLLCDIFGLHCQAIVLREFIELKWKFKAFMGEMPVSQEVRVFVRDGFIECWHNYWFEDAIEQGGTDNLPEHWKDLLKETYFGVDDSINELSMKAGMIAGKLKGYWSLDFAKGKDGKWWFIDAALGERSWHSDDCPKKKK